MSLWENFRDANEALRGLRMEYWLHGGTLLGAIREGDILGHDKDVDFGVLHTEIAKDTPARLTTWMESLGFKLFKTHGTPGFGYEQRFRRNGSAVDIFYFYPNGEKLWYGSWWGKRLIANEFDQLFLPRKPFYFRGQLTYIPAQPEKVLEAHYGADWRTPKTEWRWYADPQSIRPSTQLSAAEIAAYEARRRRRG